MTSPPSILATLLTFTIAATAPAGSPPRTHDIELEDYFSLAFVTSCAMSPSGDRIAYTEMRWEKANDGRNTDLWVVDVATKARTRLTFDFESDSNPTWSADGRWIYFTTRRGDDETPPRNGKRQVWRIPAAGGDVIAVTRLEDGIDAYELSRDGRTLYYTTGADHVEPDAWKSLRKEFDELDYGHGVVEVTELWALDLESWRAEKIVDADRVIRELAVAPDGSRIAMLTTPTAELITNEGWSRVDVYDAATKRIESLADRLWRDEAPSPYGWLMGPTWSDDSLALAFGVGYDGYQAEMLVARFGGEAPVITQLDRADEVSLEGMMAWLPGTRDLCYVGEDHARARVYRIRDAGTDRPGATMPLTPGDVVVRSFSFDRAGDRLAVIMRDPQEMGDLFVLGTDDEPAYRKVTDINPQVAAWKLPQLRIVKWVSPDGTPVEGILELPADWTRADGPLPTVVHLHGGPTSSTKYAQQFWIYGRTLFASRGWALFSPNYRGSTGYGDRFVTDLIGHENGRDVSDILSGVDAMVERGIVDPDRLAVMGWSNGGYLTNCLITRSDRFKAASSGAGVFDMTMQWAIEDTPGHVINYMEGLPWTNPEETHKASPLYDVQNVVTPTIIHMGEKDARVPVQHGRALHRALHHYLNVPTELVIYPGAGHGLTKYEHRRAKLAWDQAWFDYYVLGKSAESAEEK